MIKKRRVILLTDERLNQDFKISELDKDLQMFILKTDATLTAQTTIPYTTLLNFRFQHIN